MVWRLLEHWTFGDGGWVDTELIWTLGCVWGLLEHWDVWRRCLGSHCTHLDTGMCVGLSLLRVLNWTRRLDLKLGHGDCGVCEVKDIAGPVGWTFILVLLILEFQVKNECNKILSCQ